ncbi:MGDG synthase family glycosyltransferase [Pontiella sulfatireligans]|uniref:Processive diacylglycerol beta-glucosyltransferase n=1 Tax=Pontiella sulfatireligans TaxID=2750658 RepID=A0A6C2UD66_9BACT|nr:glycosyltransferase [Pontiella sulfatireligans]VGO18142.1 Processive diacylglycerol beta-glucosyltransferase [Pontiella sulfatireligans]
MTRVLILYIVRNSGHHTAARYLETAFRKQCPDVETRCVDLLAHLHPKWGKIIERMYMTTIRRTPELWEALYDNFWVERLTRRLRQLVQKGKSESLQRLMAEFNPDAVVCTQAYPFAVIASFAARQASRIPLLGVTTDFVPHRFWVMNNGTNPRYVVPTDSAAARLIWLGVNESRICVFGIPVPATAALGGPLEKGRVLVMGGGRALGIRCRTIKRLDRCPNDFTIDVVCGTNRHLRKRLMRCRQSFQHRIRIRGYVRNAVELMHRSDLMITKPGGVTLAEAICAGVPLLLVRPLPGQEKGNAEVLVHHGAALHVRNEYDVNRSVTTLLNNRKLLIMMRDKALALARPDAADRIVRHVLNLVSEQEST